MIPRRCLTLAIATIMAATACALPCGAALVQDAEQATNAADDAGPAPLSRTDERRVTEFEAQMESLTAQAKLTEAAGVARQVRELRERAQGKGHWETRDAVRLVETLLRVAALPDEERAAYAELGKLLKEAARLTAQAQYADALPLEQKALAIRRKVLGEEHSDTGQSLHNVAVNLNEQGRARDARPLLEQALAIARKTLGEDHPGTATCTMSLAVMLNDQGSYVEAQPLFEKALRIMRGAWGENHPMVARAYDSLATNLQSQGRFADAQPLFDKSLAIARRTLGDKDVGTAVAYHNLAANLRALRRDADALAPSEKALAILQQAFGDNHPFTAKSYYNVASALQAMGRYADAQPRFERALAIQRKILGEIHRDTAISLRSLASNLSDQGRDAEAQPLYERALAIMLKAMGENNSDTAITYNDVAMGLQRRGRYAEAQPFLEKALAIWQRTLPPNHPNIATAYGNVALNLDGQGRFADARPIYEQALAIDRKAFGERGLPTGLAYGNLANNLQASGRAADALPLAEKSRTNLVEALGEQHPNTARAHAELARAYYQAGRVGDAESEFAAAASSYLAARGRIAVGGLDRAARSEQVSPMTPLACLLAKNGATMEAWERFESGLARGLLDDLSSRQSRRLSDADRQSEQQLLARLDRLEALARAQAAQTPEARERLEQERLAANAEWSALQKRLEATYGVAEGQAFELARIQPQIPADSALVGWLDFDLGEHWAVVVRRSGPPRWVQLAGHGQKGAWTTDDESLGLRLAAALADRARIVEGAPRQAVVELRALRLAPLAPLLAAADGLPAARRLIVLPSPALRGVPIELLAEGYTISHAPSGSIFAWLREKPRAQSLRSTTASLLVLADPQFTDASPGPQPPAAGPPAPGILLAAGPDLDRLLRGLRDGQAVEPLPGTRHEAAALVKLVEAKHGRVTSLVGADASKRSLRRLASRDELRGYTLLHFATHGVPNLERAFDSQLLLARPESADPLRASESDHFDDGKLTAGEVRQRWTLDAELVTISACESAVGRYAGGEGYLGFTQALLLSGARSVVLSLWKVDDRATALLMQRFYANLLGAREGLKEPLPKAEALQDAQSWLRTLDAAEAERLTQSLPTIERGGKVVDPRPPRPATEAAPSAVVRRPFAHPYYWAAFILVGDPD
jgi:CHAT domain-containing protein/tetratricopeptide (TPR) repeat protein